MDSFCSDGLVSHQSDGNFAHHAVSLIERCFAGLQGMLQQGEEGVALSGAGFDADQRAVFSGTGLRRRALSAWRSSGA